MALRSEEARVLACLIEKETTVPDSYPLTLNALRLACNQSTARHPVVAYDDRTVEQALVSLKSMGLVRFVHPAHGGRTTRYRHTADERWRLDRAELGVLAVLVLRGPQTVGEVRARAERHLTDSSSSAEELLDTLAARAPEPFAVRLARRAGEREARYAHLLTGEVEDVGDAPVDASGEIARPPRAHEGTGALADEVARLRERLDRLERLLGVEPEDDVGDRGGDQEDEVGPLEPGTLNG
jgi:uncharacterized protein YceH (UPF0502 family)